MSVDDEMDYAAAQGRTVKGIMPSRAASPAAELAKPSRKFPERQGTRKGRPFGRLAYQAATARLLRQEVERIAELAGGDSDRAIRLIARELGMRPALLSERMERGFVCRDAFAHYAAAFERVEQGLLNIGRLRRSAG